VVIVVIFIRAYGGNGRRQLLFRLWRSYLMPGTGRPFSR
jgi:hypothetical protein